MAVKTRLANPSGLLIVNPSKGRTMRKTRSRTRKPHTTAKRRSNKSRAIVRSHRGVAHYRARSRRRRPNPGLGGGVISEALTLAGAGALTQFIVSLIPPIGGSSAQADAGRTAGVAYLLGLLAQKIGFGRYARLITLGGMAVAGGKMINSFLLPAATSVFQPKPKATTNGNTAAANGVGDIVTLPRGTWDDYYGSTPGFRTPSASGMGDIVTVPRRVSGY